MSYLRLLQNLFCTNKAWEEENVFSFQIFGNCKIGDKDLLAHRQHLGTIHADLNQKFEDIFRLDIPDWQLNRFARAQIHMNPY